jgi:hypothetical protein
MTFEQKIKDIIETMIEWDMIDPARLYDSDYVAERVALYIKSRNFVIENFKGCF